MIRNKWRTALSAGILLASFVTTSCDHESSETLLPDASLPDAEKRDLVLMTSLPLVWGDGQDIEAVISGGAKPHPFYTGLLQSYNILPIDSLTQEGVLGADNPDILLLAQNRPLAPEELVALDEWIRGGGRALIMADPLLRMESGYPIGDKRRPEGVSLMSPLFNRWGLDFTYDDSAGSVEIEAGNFDISAFAVGGFNLKENQDPDIAICTVGEVTMLARCQVGQGRAAIIADADMLDTQLLSKSDNAKFISALLDEVQQD